MPATSLDCQRSRCATPVREQITDPPMSAIEGAATTPGSDALSPLDRAVEVAGLASPVLTIVLGFSFGTRAAEGAGSAAHAEAEGHAQSAQVGRCQLRNVMCGLQRGSNRWSTAFGQQQPPRYRPRARGRRVATLARTRATCLRSSTSRRAKWPHSEHQLVGGSSVWIRGAPPGPVRHTASVLLFTPVSPGLWLEVGKHRDSKRNSHRVSSGWTGRSPPSGAG